MNADIFNTIMEVQNELIREKDFIPFIVEGNVVFKNINLVLSKEYVFLSKILADDRKEISPKISYASLGTDKIVYAKSANKNLYKHLKYYDINSIHTDCNKFIKLKDDKSFINELEEIKFKNKLSLIEYLEVEGEGINPHSIFDMQLSIMHESKRQILNALAIAYEFYYLRDNSNAYFTPKTYIFSGKANEGYFMAKETIKFILGLKHLIESDPIIREKIKIVFVEDLGVRDLNYLYPACDIYSNLTLPLLDNQNFDILNSIFNMSNILSAKGGIIDNHGSGHDFYLMGDDYKTIKARSEERSYIASDFIYQNEIVKYTTDKLLNESSDSFPYDFRTLYDEILLYNDSFNVFYDLEALINVRRDISKDYLDKEKWVGQEIANIMWANSFNFNEIKKRKISFDKKFK